MIHSFVSQIGTVSQLTKSFLLISTHASINFFRDYGGMPMEFLLTYVNLTCIADVHWLMIAFLAYGQFCVHFPFFFCAIALRKSLQFQMYYSRRNAFIFVSMQM